MLSSAQVADLRAALVGLRESLTAQFAALSRELTGIMEASALVATDDEHDPEGATIAFERAQSAALLGRVRDRLADLDHALNRLADGTYGQCERCGAGIPIERLTARPATRTCIACAR
jgi:RNA polymerase-binding transcription factor